MYKITLVVAALMFNALAYVMAWRFWLFVQPDIGGTVALICLVPILHRGLQKATARLLLVLAPWLAGIRIEKK